MLTVVVPPSSGIEAGVSTSVTAGVASLSTIVTGTPADGSTVRPDTAPVTFTVSSGSSVVSLFGIRSKVAEPLVLPPVMVTVKSLTAVKSSSSVAVSASTETVTTASEASAEPFSVAVTVTVRALTAAFSATVAGDTVSVTWFDAPSSSVMVSVLFEGAVTARSFAAVADTVTLLFPPATLLSLAVIVTVPVLAVDPAAMVSVEPLSVKSAATAGETAIADTVSVVASLDARSSVAVTVLDPPSSEIDVGLSTSVAAGVASLSVIVPFAAVVVPEVAFVGVPSVTVKVSFDSSTVSLVVAIEIVPVVEPA